MKKIRVISQGTRGFATVKSTFSSGNRNARWSTFFAKLAILRGGRFQLSAFLAVLIVGVPLGRAQTPASSFSLSEVSRPSVGTSPFGAFANPGRPHMATPTSKKDVSTMLETTVGAALFLLFSLSSAAQTTNPRQTLGGRIRCLQI